MPKVLPPDGTYKPLPRGDYNPHTIERPAPRPKFDTWMQKVDEHLVSRCGMDSEDLPDYGYADEFDAGTTPADTARLALRHAQDF